MRVVAFAPALSTTDDAAGGVVIKGFPMTLCQVKGFPNQVTIPVVVAVCAAGGSDYNPRMYIVVTSPEGERVGSLEFSWEWPDNPPQPVKFRVFSQYVPIRVEHAGVYTLGLYDSLEATHSDNLFPLPIIKSNPLIS